MKSKISAPACTGLAALLALSACGPEDAPKDNKATANNTPRSGPGSTPAAELGADQKSKHFDAVSAHLDLGGIVYGYLDIDGDAEKLAATLQDFLGLAKEAADGSMPPQIANLDVPSVLDELGLAGIEALGMSSYKNGDLYRNKYYLHVPAGREGLLKMLGGQAGAFAAQSLAPTGSDFVMEQQLDLKSGFEIVQSLVAKVGGAEAAAQFSQMTTEPMPGPGLTVAEIFANLDTRVTIVGRFHGDKKMTLPEMPVELPATDALIALENVGPLVTKLVASIPDDQRAGMLEEGDGFQQMAIPVPPELGQSLQPVVRHELASGRLLVATSPAFLEECLAGKTSLWDDAGFKTAMADLPTKGNGMSYVSSNFSKTYLNIYGEFMASLSDEGAAPAGLDETVSQLLQSMGMSPDHHQARVVANLPEGILITENSAASAKQMIVAGGAGVAALFTGAVFAPMRYTTKMQEEVIRAHEVETELLETTRELPAPTEETLPE